MVTVMAMTLALALRKGGLQTLAFALARINCSLIGAACLNAVQVARLIVLNLAALELRRNPRLILILPRFFLGGFRLLLLGALGFTRFDVKQERQQQGDECQPAGAAQERIVFHGNLRSR